jgi:hypothetical protein
VGEPILWAAARPPNTTNAERTVGLGSVRARHDKCHIQNHPRSGATTGRKPQLGKVPARKSPLTRMKSLARRADRSVRTFLRFVAVVAALVAVFVYWNFGTFSPCDALREAIRQRGDLAALFPDGFIDFAFEAKFGEMSAKRCFAVLLEAVTSPVPITGQASQLSIQPFVPQQGKQRSSPSVPRSAPFALRAAAIDPMVEENATAFGLESVSKFVVRSAARRAAPSPLAARAYRSLR